LLALDTRSRHATRQRYRELLNEIAHFHQKDKAKIPDIQQCLSFDGDSFEEKLIDVCVSHNEGAEVLVEKDRENFERPRFPRDYPVGSATADTQLIAAALRVADILDFDRERTPAVLFYYLIPGDLQLGENISALEWNKHLAISNWEVDPTAIVFRGRSKSHVVHHAVVQFCEAIEEEISATKATFGSEPKWPFDLPTPVRADIHAEGYHYLPYRFELDEHRVYELLMGGAIYDNPLVAIRELVQNAVDACKYRDALSKVQEGHFQPETKNRIHVRYNEPKSGDELPTLTVTDTGTGMDAWAIERWFLKVGRSFYTSTEFARDRAELRRQGVDFAPVSEFGIGFLSCFLLADRVEVETAMWEPVRGDTRKRHLEIDGPTRLIRIRESANEGIKRFKGTRITLHLARGGQPPATESQRTPPKWPEIEDYLRDLCQDLPYRLNLEHVTSDETLTGIIDPHPMVADVPPPYTDKAFRISIANEALGIEGEVAIVPAPEVRKADLERIRDSAVSIKEDRAIGFDSVLLRGGFKLGPAPGVPWGGTGSLASSRIRLLWRGNADQTYKSTNLARTSAGNIEAIAASVSQAWLRSLLDNLGKLPSGCLSHLESMEHYWGPYRHRSHKKVDPHEYYRWMEEFDAFTVYCLARNGWSYDMKEPDKGLDPVTSWEEGTSSIWFSGLYLYGDLLKLILPRVVPTRGYDRPGASISPLPFPTGERDLGRAGITSQTRSHGSHSRRTPDHLQTTCTMTALTQGYSIAGTATFSPGWIQTPARARPLYLVDY
jgi:hypothetical protein